MLKNTLKGFSLIEMVVTVAIIGILASVGGIKYSKYLKSSRAGRLKNELIKIQTAFRACQITLDLADCNTLSKIDVTINPSEFTSTVNASGSSICFGLVNKHQQKGCYSYNSNSSKEIIPNQSDIVANPLAGVCSSTVCSK